jgi:ribokinase
VDTTYIAVTDAAASGVAPIMVDAQGHNSIVIVTGANDLLTVDELEGALPALNDAAVLACQLELPLETTLAALRMGRAAGVRTVVNPAPARGDLPAELLQLSDVLCPNQGEAALLVGAPVESIPDAAAAGRSLIDRGAGSVVITLGDNGCMVVEDGMTQHIAETAVPVTDTTGAGDAFVGALCYFLASGCPLPRSAERATVIAGRSVRKQGTQTSFPDRAELPAALFHGLS